MKMNSKLNFRSLCNRVGKPAINRSVTFAIVILFYVIMQLMIAGDALSRVMQGVLVPICVYAVLALSLNLTVGVLGELSLGHAGFMSIGAFTGAVVSSAMAWGSVDAELPRLIIAIIAGAVIAAIAGLLIGIPVLRLRGDYLAIVTLAFGEIIKGLFTNLYVGIDEDGLHFAFLKNTMGLSETGKELISGPMGANGIQTISTFTAGIVLILICLIFIYNYVRSKTGRAVMAIRDNVIAAESVGIGATKYKLMTFAISAAMAGGAGALYGLNYATIQASKFDYNTSILILVLVVLGGLGNMRGSIIAAAILTILPEKLRFLRDYRMLIYAIILIVIMLLTNNPILRGYLIRLRTAVISGIRSLLAKFRKTKEVEKDG